MKFDIFEKLNKFKVPIIIALISFIFFSIILKLISAKLNYSKFSIVILAVISIAFAVIILLFIAKNFRAIKAKSAFQLLSALCIIFFIFSISAFRENGRILKLENSYQAGITSMNLSDWKAAISSFDYVVRNSKNFKNVTFLLDSSQFILNNLIADSCLQVAKNLIAKSSFSDAISAIDKAKSLIGNENKINNAYYLASTSLLVKAEEEYRVKEYENAVNHSNLSLKYMTELPQSGFNNLSHNINKATNISSKAQSKLDQIKKEQERERQKQLEIKQARDRALEAARIEEGRKMAAAFNILAFKGKKDKIGWTLCVDLTNILKQFNYNGYTVTGGTKIELYDGIIYQAECTKNNDYYYAYLKSNLAFDRWTVTGVYRRSY